MEPDIGGERGGGKRHEKPPEGMFDVEEPEIAPLPKEPGGDSEDIIVPEIATSQLEKPSKLELFPPCPIEAGMPSDIPEIQESVAIKIQRPGMNEAVANETPKDTDRLQEPSSEYVPIRTPGIYKETPPVNENIAPEVLPAAANNRHNSFRTIVSLLAVAAGGMAGFFMIRRR